jgi:hypothetical protein
MRFTWTGRTTVPALVATAVLATGCSSDEYCGDLTLALTEDAGAYPTSASVSCELRAGGVWNRTKNEATIVVSGTDFPDDLYLSATMPLAMLAPGVVFTVPNGIAGEAYTSADAPDRKNHAFLTEGTATIIRDIGVDTAASARVFQIKWDLTWLGTGNYHSTAETAVWFNGVGPL